MRNFFVSSDHESCYLELMNGARSAPTKGPEMNAKISAAIASKIAAGMTVPEAVDAVLGAGAYAKIAGDLYDALRAKAA